MVSQIVSANAKSFVHSLVVADGSKRISISKLKKHKFFQKINWSNLEKGHVKMPNVKLKKPKVENFDEIQYDSDDPDFQHEYEALETLESRDRSNTLGKDKIDTSDAISELSAFYNKTPAEA
jgi:hypothetical protein